MRTGGAKGLVLPHSIVVVSLRCGGLNGKMKGSLSDAALLGFFTPMGPAKTPQHVQYSLYSPSSSSDSSA